MNKSKGKSYDPVTTSDKALKNSLDLKLKINFPIIKLVKSLIHKTINLLG